MALRHLGDFKRCARRVTDGGQLCLVHRIRITWPGLPTDWRADIESYLSDFNVDGVSGFEDFASIWNELWTPILDHTIKATR